MLQKLTIQDFQSHKSTVVELVSGVNVFVGSSDAGKTAILRSIYWILKNRPLGEGFIHHGSNEVAVKTVWGKEDKNLDVGRKRNKTENLYSLSGYEDFTAFGTSPPKEVLEAINLSDINLQRQFSPYFLVMDSPGVVAKYIKSATGLAEIDRITEIVSSKVRKNKAELTREEVGLAELLKKIKILERIPLKEFELTLETFEELFQQSAEKQEQLELLEDICRQLKALKASVIYIPEKRFLQIGREISETSQRFEKNNLRKNQLLANLNLWKILVAEKVEISKDRFEVLEKDIQETLKRYEAGISKRTKLSSSLSLWKNLREETLEISFNVESVKELAEQYRSSCQKLLRIHELIETIKFSSLEAEKAQLDLEKLKEEEKELQQQLKVCPKCGMELTEKSREVLLGG